MREYTLKVNQNELNTLLNILAERPYKDVVGFITKVAAQVQEQNKPVAVPDQQPQAPAA